MREKEYQFITEVLNTQVYDITIHELGLQICYINIHNHRFNTEVFLMTQHMITEQDIQHILYQTHLKNNSNIECVIPNCKGLGVKGESDMLAVTSSMLVHEYEIKCSTQDLLREFKTKEYKHSMLSSYFGSTNDNRTNHEPPNYYHIVCPESILVDDIDIPEYAGLVTVDCENESLNILRKAPRIHNKKISMRLQKYIMRGLSIRYWNSAIS